MIQKYQIIKTRHITCVLFFKTHYMCNVYVYHKVCVWFVVWDVRVVRVGGGGGIYKLTI